MDDAADPDARRWRGEDGDQPRRFSPRPRAIRGIAATARESSSCDVGNAPGELQAAGAAPVVGASSDLGDAIGDVEGHNTNLQAGSDLPSIVPVLGAVLPLSTGEPQMHRGADAERR